MKDIEKYNDLSSLWYFDKKWCENIDDTDREFIKPMTEAYSSALWSNCVSAKCNHLMWVKNSSDWKVINNTTLDCHWSGPWEEDNYHYFYDVIAPLMSWDLSDSVYYFWGQFSGLETSWNLLCKYWIAFLYEDEMNIIINPASKEVLILGVSGIVAKGERILCKSDGE